MQCMFILRQVVELGENIDSRRSRYWRFESDTRIINLWKLAVRICFVMYVVIWMSYSPIDMVKTSLQAFQNYVERIYAMHIHITPSSWTWWKYRQPPIEVLAVRKRHAHYTLVKTCCANLLRNACCNLNVIFPNWHSKDEYTSFLKLCRTNLCHAYSYYAK
jgi:hypothetical protein